MAPDLRARFEGRRAIVTGGAGAIGAHVVRRLTAEGAVVTVVDIDGDAAAGLCAELERNGCPAEVAIGDVTDEALIDSVVTSPTEPAQILVNCAARRTFRSVLEIDAPFLQQHVTLNTIAPALWTRAFARRIIDAEMIGGSVVNITSIVAERGFPLNGAYAASKAALLAYSRCAAVDLAPFGIRVNCVAPGPTRTPLTADLFANEEALRTLERRIPLHRVAEPQEIAGAVAFLASDDSAFVTGVTVPVDGGYLVG